MTKYFKTHAEAEAFARTVPALYIARDWLTGGWMVIY